MLIALWFWALVGGVIDRDIFVGRGSSTTLSSAVAERPVQVLEDGTPKPPGR